MAFQINEAKVLLERVLNMQPRIGGGEGGKTPDEVVYELAQNVFENLPANLDPEEAGEATFATNEEGMMTSLAVVLSQEMVRVRSALRTKSSFLKNDCMFSARFTCCYFDLSKERANFPSFG
eukprot:8157338-Pyramimonas_sp.AAC.1